MPDRIDSKFGKYSPILLNIGLLIAVFFVVTAFQSRNLLPTDRQAAPTLRAMTLQGETYNLESSLGQPVLVYFFAPWCNYCAASSGNLVRLRNWRSKFALDIVVVALDWQDIEEVRAYADRHELNVPVVLGNSQIARDWNVFAFPTYYVLDYQHRVARRDLGYSTQLGLWWRTRAD